MSLHLLYIKGGPGLSGQFSKWDNLETIKDSVAIPAANESGVQT